MNEWLETALRVVIGAVVAGAVGAVAATLRTSARLRRDLGQDVVLLANCPPGARGLLSEHVARKTKLLIAYERFPTLVGADLLRLAVVIGFPTLVVLQAISIRRGDDIVASSPDLAAAAFTYFSAVGSQWYYFHAGFLWRAHDREALLQNWDVASDPDDHEFWDSLRGVVSTMLGAVALSGPPIYIFLALHETKNWPEYQLAVAVLLTAVGGALVFALGLRISIERPQGLAARRAAERRAYRAAAARRRRKREARRSRREV
ncbi:MAG: hypothetical protein PGN15_09765 [Aeromicrobium erythreum]